MIYIKDTNMPTTNIVSALDRIIAVKNDNNFISRTFVLPGVFYGINLLDSNFTFVLQISSDVKNSTPYMDILEKEIINNDIHLTWNIKRHNTQQSSKLTTNILITNSDQDIVKQTYPVEFTVVNGIDALEYLAEIPPNIFQQMIAEFSDYVQEVRTEIGSVKSDIEDILESVLEMGSFINQYNSIYDFPNQGSSKVLYVDISTNTSYRWDDAALKYYIIGTDYNNISIINGGTANG